MTKTTKTDSEILKEWKKATLANNFIFYKVMRHHPDACKQLIEMLLNIKSVIEQSEYLGTTKYKGRNCHVFETELCGDKTWIIVTDAAGRGLSVYSISDGEEILKDIKKPV